MSILNFRVFRRNSKNLILLWSTSHLDDERRGKISAFLVDPTDAMSEGRELKFSKFVPDNPEKFTPDVAGIVVSHSANGMDPAQPCTIRVILGDGEDAIELVKNVLPENSVAVPPRPAAPRGETRVHMYAMDYSSNQWVPWPSDGVVPPNIQVSLKEE